MKIEFKESLSNINQLVIIEKEEKLSANFLKQNNISESILQLANNLGAANYSSGKGINFLLCIDKKSHPKKTTDQLCSWTHNQLSALPKVLGLILSKSVSNQLESILFGILKGRYQIDLFKGKDKSAIPFITRTAKIIVKGKKSVVNTTMANAIVHISESQKMAMDMVNKPSNKLTAEAMGRYARQSAKKYNYSVKILSKKQIEKAGLHALLAVNRGSENDPVFIIAEYKGKVRKGKKLPTIGLAGKGITFDTGGISMKGSNNMHYMKSDMGGAAAVLGTMDAAARLKLPIHLIGIVPATDNSVDARAIKPGDVIQSCSGKTIEVLDTDAEGRLVLADGLWYLQDKFKPQVMIDLATLTGSSVLTFGYEAAALFSNDEQLAKALIKAGKATGERCWPLPLWENYSSYLHSDIADIRNFSGKPVAGAISAAKFLEVFTNEHPSWAHLDIAGVAFGNSPLGKDRNGTGYGIRLLISYLQQNFGQ